MLMEESTTYQEILGKGLAQGLERVQLQAHRNVLLRLGAKRFGPPPPAVATVLAGDHRFESAGTTRRAHPRRNGVGRPASKSVKQQHNY
jgi:hypothetical protein